MDPGQKFCSGAVWGVRGLPYSDKEVDLVIGGRSLVTLSVEYTEGTMYI